MPCRLKRRSAVVGDLRAVERRAGDTLSDSKKRIDQEKDHDGPPPRAPESYRRLSVMVDVAINFYRKIQELQYSRAMSSEALPRGMRVHTKILHALAWDIFDSRAPWLARGSCIVTSSTPKGLHQKRHASSGAKRVQLCPSEKSRRTNSVSRYRRICTQKSWSTVKTGKPKTTIPRCPINSARAPLLSAAEKNEISSNSDPRMDEVSLPSGAGARNDQDPAMGHAKLGPGSTFASNRG